MSDQTNVEYIKVHFRFSTARIIREIFQLRNELMATRQEITDALTALRADVAAETTVVQSAEALLTGIASQLANAAATATDLDAFKTEIQTIATQIQTDTSGLSTAVASAPTLGSGPQSPPAPASPPTPGP